MPTLYEHRIFEPIARCSKSEARRRARRDGFLNASSELYFLPRRFDGRNVKIRDGRLQVKVLSDRRFNLQQWRPAIDLALPLSPSDIKDACPQIARDGAVLAGRLLYRSDLAALARLTMPAVTVFDVLKWRRKFADRRVEREEARVWTRGVFAYTSAIEAIEFSTLLGAVRRLDRPLKQNLSYPEFFLKLVTAISAGTFARPARS